MKKFILGLFFGILFSATLVVYHESKGQTTLSGSETLKLEGGKTVSLEQLKAFFSSKNSGEFCYYGSFKKVYSTIISPKAPVGQTPTEELYQSFDPATNGLKTFSGGKINSETFVDSKCRPIKYVTYDPSQTVTGTITYRYEE